MIKIGNKMLFALRYFKYIGEAKHYRGHGIHSPFIYQFVKEVLFRKDSNSNYQQIQQYKKQLLKNNQIIEIQDFGAGSNQTHKNYRKVSDIAAISTTRKKYGKLLARLVAFYSPAIIIELGTSLGVGTSYLSKYLNKEAELFSIEGAKEIFHLAKLQIEKYNNKKIHLIEGQFEQKLPELLMTLESNDFVFFDGNHTREATIRNFEFCLAKAHNNTIFVFDDIHWSNEMEDAWRFIQKHPNTRVCIDIFQFGIVFFRKELSKQNFTICF